MDASATMQGWTPPDFGNQKQTRIGASVVEEFVAGHDASDVLRELVQNEFDGGGDQLIVDFGQDALDVVGNGRGISRDGWARLSVIVGTGRVVGDGEAERVEAKRNGIGSKNFGLRSLFRFGDEIFVRSGGTVAVLDLRTLETGQVKDKDWWKGPGVRLRVPFRTETFEMLDPFSADREERAFEIMAREMLATLVKLALVGRSKGLRRLSLSSARAGKALEWRQEAQRAPCKVPGVMAIRRNGSLIDRSDKKIGSARKFEEIEFVRSIELPEHFAGRSCPDYFRSGGTSIKIAISLPLRRERVDFGRAGNFYYPLQAPQARTSVAASVSAPFELNNDRSDLRPNDWNDWLIDQAAALAVELVRADWFDRFGTDAFRALAAPPGGTHGRFADEVQRLLAEEACWPTRATGTARFAKAKHLTSPAEPALDGFLADENCLHAAFEADAEAKALALSAGVKPFTIPSLIRLRCGPEGATLQTKVPQGDAEYFFKEYEPALSFLSRQTDMARALTAIAKRLSNQNRHDLGATPSTLTAALTLRPAEDLVLVEQDIWEACPEPHENRLHLGLIGCKPISHHARKFDEQAWIIDACARARDEVITPQERAILYAKVLDAESKIGRRALSAMRSSPIAKDSRGDWTAPDDMVVLTGATAKLLSPVITMPSKALVARPELLKRLNIRSTIHREELIAFSEVIGERPQAADRFAKLLLDHLSLVTPSFAKAVEDLPFLKNRKGELAAPSQLHLDTAANRLYLNVEQLVGASYNDLYRKLRIREHPQVETLLGRIQEARGASEAPRRPDLLYPSLIAAIQRERRSKTEFSSNKIVWVADGFYAPDEVLVSTHIPHLFDEALPIVRRNDAMAQAYLALGAHPNPREQHWTRFFEHVSDNWDDGNSLPRARRHALLDAYRLRGGSGLPENLDEDAACLLDHEGKLHSLSDLRRDYLVEADHPALAKALAGTGSAVAVVELNDRSRAFYSALGIKPLSAIAGTGRAIFGEASTRPLPFKAQNLERLLSLMHRPLFAKAVHAIAAAQRHLLLAHRIMELEAIEQRLLAIQRIQFFASIEREYMVHKTRVRVPVETATGDAIIGLVTPRTKLDFQQMVAQALAEVTGAESLAQVRALSTAFFPLTLCRDNEDIRVQLDRMGIDHAAWERGSDWEPDLADDQDDEDETGEDILRQVFEQFNFDGGGTDPDNSPADGASAHGKRPEQPAPSEPDPPPPFTLPDLDEVVLTFAPPEGKEILPRPSQGGGGGGSSSGWRPRTPEEAARDKAVGDRGEALVYRMELERVRAMGHAEPEKLVTWTSSWEPGADHDIKSIDEDGAPRWLEVKSTTGVDGRFDWPKKEFQKALRERDRYELWRVYKAATNAPVAKCFPNPAEMVGASQLVLELGSLRASIESLE